MRQRRGIKYGCAMGRREFLKLTAAVGGIVVLGGPQGAGAAGEKRISVATGGMGGVYFVMGGAIAAVITKHVPNVEAAAEVTAASVDNCKLIAAKKSDLGIIMGDTAYDAWKGLGKFKQALPIQNLAVLYPNFMHVVVVEGKGIGKVADMKGKTISTGAPGSGVEVMALRILEANGINPDKDIKRDRLGASESSGALKDGKIDGYFWCGGVPTAAVLDNAASPGMKISLIPNADCIDKMAVKYGPVYYPEIIPKGVYKGVDNDVPVAAVANCLVAHENMDEKLVYEILAALFDHKADLVAVHKQAEAISLESAVKGSPIPYHKGAQKFFKEKGLNLQT
ncbi:MAG: TAXI family TRAP transporter solute-binding subunit [Desulfomonile tiedjei]|nr:TAXI family TRAP transporter solute-binding subunit [Desulfomonile tiedjei]